jgi:hypothetical protein
MNSKDITVFSLNMILFFMLKVLIPSNQWFFGMWFALSYQLLSLLPLVLISFYYLVDNIYALYLIYQPLNITFTFLDMICAVDSSILFLTITLASTVLVFVIYPALMIIVLNRVNYYKRIKFLKGMI